MLAAVLTGHACLLGGVRPPGVPGRVADAPGATALRVRQIEAERSAPLETATIAAPVAAPAPDPWPPSKPQATQAATTARAPAAPRPAARPRRVAAGAQTAPAAQTERSEALEEPAHAEPGAVPPPRYATRLPASRVLHYSLQRGAQHGSATLRWQLADDGGYALSLDGDFGRDRAGRSSSGVLDGDGLAPTRYVQTRRGREQRAVNFQRDKALITYSASVRSHALWPAAQDPVSWMLQLAAVLQAETTLREAGQRVTLFVAGPRGEAESWDFQVLGKPALELPAAAPVHTLHLRREALRPWEPQIDLWLDPQRQHLPVRLRWLVRPTGEVTELLLRTDTTP
jgi:hypothetical protein